ncbi:hypothetical protein [Candidatus Wolbachia massiliensis]|uniref:Outer membrane protein beta-barrel domain-containing protein n=1 Tax=Candidatus Wolbachia massiliensis TaxID=1845000 RepID=A0A7M3U2L9_9RICK|nr:hypothetical protein [Candidatus Wolbachia massiliensis]QOD38654.1 hypothetical protein ID128_02160 [Candidatus Wolbachia massiliensis]
MKKIFAFAILLTSSLAGIAEDATDYKHYIGLNLGGGLGGNLSGDSYVSLAAIAESSIVFGYHYNRNSKFELEALYSLKSSLYLGRLRTGRGIEMRDETGISLLANYRFYPICDPVKLYVSGGLGAYFQPISLNLNVSTTDKKGDRTESNGEGNNNISLIEKYDSPLDSILDSIAYKLKVGIDYKIIQRLGGIVGVTLGERLLSLKALKVPDITLEVGVRYNF